MRHRSLHLDRLALFVAVAESGGFTAAAAELGATKTLVSQQIGRLEAELGGTLFTRTTRRVRLTEAGERLFEETAPLLRQLGDAVERFGSASARPSGTLRVTTPPDYAATVVGPALAEFARLHPQVQVELVATSELRDLVAERLDLGIRFGWLRDSSLRATQLGEFAQHVVAAPAYLARAGTPKRPDELGRHRWVALSLLRAPLSWRFTGAGGRERLVRVRAELRASSPEAVLGLVRGGAGVTVLADFTIDADVASGRLVRLLGGWSLPRGGIYAVYPAARHVPVKVRAFIDFLRARLAGVNAAPA